MPQLFGTALRGSDSFKFKGRDDLVDECNLLGGGVDERHIEGRASDLQGKPWKPGAGSYVHQTDHSVSSIRRGPRETVQLRDHSDCIKKEPAIDLFRVSDRCQVELRASLEEKSSVLDEALQGTPVD